MTTPEQVKAAIEIVKNFRDRYKEWAEKDDNDVNIKALNTLLSFASQKLEEGKDKSDDPTCCRTCGRSFYEDPVVYQCPRCATSMEIDPSAKPKVKQETLSERELVKIILHTYSAHKKTSYAETLMSTALIKDIAKALLGKIPCNGSGRTTDREARYREALARGYCSPENSGKVLDVELMEAMVRELTALNEGKG